MPYKIEKRGSQWCVVKDDGSGDRMGCHDSEGGAQSQIRALYANEPEAEVESLFKEAYTALGDPPAAQARIW